jgi:tetratricopeptide (TPR) repeat protein
MKDVSSLPLAVTAADGRAATVPLRQVASVQKALGPARIDHLDRERVVSVQANTEGRPLTEVMAAIEDRLAASNISLPAGYTLRTGGETEDPTPGSRNPAMTGGGVEHPELPGVPPVKNPTSKAPDPTPVPPGSALAAAPAPIPPGTLPEAGPRKGPEGEARPGAAEVVGHRARLYLRRPEGGILLEIERRFRERVGGPGPLRGPDGRPIRVEDDGGTGTILDSIAAVDADGVRLFSVAPVPPSDDPVAALRPPLPLVGPSLLDVRLACERKDRASTAAALASLLGGDAATAEWLLAPTAPTPGTRILRAWAALLRGDLPAVHGSVGALRDDPDLGAVARLLSGAALRADGSVREALRDFEAALALRPGWWPALLLAAEAWESPEVRLMDRAASAYAAAHAAAPADLAAALGHAFHLAATSGDRAASRRVIDEALAAEPESVAAWRMLGWWHAQGGTVEDLRRAVAAYEHVATLRAADARTWSDVGAARWALAEAGGGAAAAEGALEAYARATVLAPEDPTTWARRGAALHQAAVDGAGRADAATRRARLGQARECYARALALGIPREEGARVRFNLGLLADLLPPDAPVAEGAPTARAAYAAALDLDPGYVEAGTALVAAQVAARDPEGASAALARLPDATDPTERGVLEAAVALLRGDTARARERLTGPGGTPVPGEDVRPAVAGALLVLGHRRAAVAVVGDDAPDAASWVVRARALAGLREPDGVRAALARLETIDRAQAERLRRDDPEVRAALE